MDKQQSQPHQPLGSSRDLTKIILRNALVVALASWVFKAVGFFYLIAVVRLLGDSGYGSYAATLAFVGMFGVFFELGLTQYVERSLAKDQSLVKDLLGDLIALRLLLAVVAVVVLPALASLFGYESPIVLGTLIYSGTFILSAFLVPLSTILSAAERFDTITAVQVRGQIFGIVAGLAVLALGGGFMGLLAVGYLVYPIQILFTIWAVRQVKLSASGLRVRPSNWSALLAAGLPFGLTSLALTFNFNADTVILSSFRSMTEVGWYNAAYGLVFKLVAVADGLLLTMTPSLTREQTNDPERVLEWTAQAIGWLAFFSLPAAVGLSVLAGPAVTTLYGDSFAPSGLVLAIIAWDVPLLLFTAFCGNVAVAMGNEWPAARIYLLSMVLNVTLNLLLIPMHGMVAAATITLLTDGLSALLFLSLLCRTFHLGRLTFRLKRIGLASALMGSLVFLARDLPLPLAVIAGVLSYGTLVLAFCLIEPSLLLRMLRRLN